MAEQIPQEDTQTVRWRCDVCHVRTFDTLDEACSHEEECRLLHERQKQQQQQQQKQRQQEETQKKVLHPFFLAKSNNRSSSNNKADIANPNLKFESGNGHSYRSTDPATTNTTNPKGQKDEANTTCASKRKKENPTDSMSKPNKKTNLHAKYDTIPNSSSARSDNIIDFDENAGTAEASVAKKQKSTRNSNGSKTGSVNLVQLVHPKNAQKVQVKASKSQKSSAKQQKVPPLASIFRTDSRGKSSDEKTLMAQQRTAEFQAQRRLERERERKRQKRRQEAFANGRPAKFENIKTIALPSHETSSYKFSCPRFPVPSFLSSISNQPQDERSLPERANESVNDSVLEEAKTKLQLSLLFPNKERLHFSSQGETPFPYLAVETAAKQLQHRHVFRSVQEELAKYFIPPVCHDKTSTNDNILTANHSLDIADICGRHNKLVAKELVSFVEEWMVERHNANQRMAERQRALQKRKRSRKKKGSSDDDLWDELDDDELRLPSTCLIEGPVGSFKSSLVYAVADHCGCQVLELNPSEKRDGPNLRRALEEATQSHSSLDMLKTREASLFAKEELVDCQGEDDDASLSDESVREANKSSLTVVLIDEVDNIYESSGDSGFWSALNELSRKARCPIFLTANDFPKGMDSPSLRFRHARTLRPSCQECAVAMESVLLRIGIQTQQNVLETRKILELLAQLCNCDLRRIMNELQAFTECSPNLLKEKLVTACSLHQSIESASVSEPSRFFIKSVSPNTVPFDQFSAITIRCHGLAPRILSGASKHDVRVYIGNQQCPRATVLNKETIIALSPPCRRLWGVDEHGCRFGDDGRRRMSLDASFVPVSIKLICPDGSTSQSTSLRETLLVDDSCIHEVLVATIEFSFPERSCRFIGSKDNDDSELSECEFESPGVRPSGNWSVSVSSYLQRREWYKSDSGKLNSDIPDYAELMWKDALAQKASYDFSTESTAEAKKDCLGGGDEPSGVALLKSLDLVARDRQVASDACMLEDFQGVCVERSDEDFLLSNATPDWFLNLPSILLRSRETGEDNYSYLKDAACKNIMDSQKESLLDCLHFFLSDEARAKMSCSGVTICLDPLSAEKANTAVFLDYAPLLRCIGVLERAACNGDPEGQAAGMVTSRRRTTRKSARLGRRHYFEHLNPEYRWNAPEGGQWNAGEVLARAWLNYEASTECFGPEAVETKE